MKSLFAAAALSVGLAGCAAPVQHMTASGKVEETFHMAPDQVKPIIISKMVDYGYNLTKDTSYVVAFDRPVTNILAAALMGSKYDAQPNTRISYMFAPIGTDTRVVVDFAVVTNPGSAFERLTPVNGNADTMKIQAWLDNAATGAPIPASLTMVRQ